MILYETNKFPLWFKFQKFIKKINIATAGTFEPENFKKLLWQTAQSIHKSQCSKSFKIASKLKNF